MVDKALKESLSALIDSQASEIEIHRLVRDLENKRDLRESWSKYRQIGEVLRQEDQYSAGLHLKLSEQISQAVANEPPLNADVTLGSQGVTVNYLKPIGGLAVAASLIIAAVVGFQQYDQTLNSPTPVVAAAPELIQPIDPQTVSREASNAELLASERVLDPIIESDLRDLEPEKQARLREYLNQMDRRFNQMNQNNRTVQFPNQKNP